MIFFQFKNVDIFKRLFALIGENGQGIGTSSFSNWVQNVSKLDLPTDEKLAADELIDSCYVQLEEGIQCGGMLRPKLFEFRLMMCFDFSNWVTIPEQRRIGLILDWKQSKSQLHTKCTGNISTIKSQSPPDSNAWHSMR